MKGEIQGTRNAKLTQIPWRLIKVVWRWGKLVGGLFIPKEEDFKKPKHFRTVSLHPAQRITTYMLKNNFMDTTV